MRHARSMRYFGTVLAQSMEAGRAREKKKAGTKAANRRSIQRFGISAEPVQHGSKPT